KTVVTSSGPDSARKPVDFSQVVVYRRTYKIVSPHLSHAVLQHQGVCAVMARAGLAGRGMSHGHQSKAAIKWGIRGSHLTCRRTLASAQEQTGVTPGSVFLRVARAVSHPRVRPLPARLFVLFDLPELRPGHRTACRVRRARELSGDAPRYTLLARLVEH